MRLRRASTALTLAIAIAGPPGIVHAARPVPDLALLERAARTGSLAALVAASARAAGLPLPTPDLRAPAAAPWDGLVSAIAGVARPRIAPARPAGLLDLRAGRARATALPAAERVRSLTAALRLAAEIDRALPLLAATDAHASGAGPCDVVDVPPALCVGGAEANTYTGDYALVIDLGGDDLHLHSAGGAAPRGAGSNGLAVSITIDLGGDDVYRATDRTVAQGAATAGGLGMLVDVEGDDSYTVEAVQSTIARGQGWGESGVGILADLDGDDAYAITASNPRNASAFGAGSATIGGLGILSDRGAGTDSYRIETRPSEPITVGSAVSLTQSDAHGFGMASIGSLGLFADGGGTDRMDLIAATARIEPDDPRPQVLAGPAWNRGQAAPTAEGFGAGAVQGGQGIHLSGPGDTVRTLRVETEAPLSGTPAAIGFGWAWGEATGTLRDGGGDDTYIARSISHAAHHAACSCAAVAEATRVPGSRFVYSEPETLVMGYGERHASGVLHDASGDDTYDAQMSVRAHARLTVPPDGSGGEAAAFTDSITLAAQGVGRSGVGLLSDHAGNDTYLADAHTEATTEIAGAGPVEASASAGGVVTHAQGAAAVGTGPTGIPQVQVVPGDGSLIDGGGVDSYAASARASADIPGGAGAVGPVRTSAQGSAESNSVALLVDDGGGADSYLVIPDDPPCEGIRGEGIWIDCGRTAGVGIDR